MYLVFIFWFDLLLPKLSRTMFYSVLYAEWHHSIGEHVNRKQRETEAREKKKKPFNSGDAVPMEINVKQSAYYVCNAITIKTYLNRKSVAQKCFCQFSAI